MFLGHTSEYQQSVPFGIRRPNHEADHSHAFRTTTENVWNFTFTLLTTSYKEIKSESMESSLLID
jgi:hypothetical protein